MPTERKPRKRWVQQEVHQKAHPCGQLYLESPPTSLEVFCLIHLSRLAMNSRAIRFNRKFSITLRSSTRSFNQETVVSTMWEMLEYNGVDAALTGGRKDQLCLKGPGESELKLNLKGWERVRKNKKWKRRSGILGKCTVFLGKERRWCWDLGDKCTVCVAVWMRTPFREEPGGRSTWEGRVGGKRPVCKSWRS